ncbi:tetratricopeptide repeat protein [candidate division KSB1 bacterium]|nr:tetratricopeptide repeat protein [candidate division KSB1 bacterium]
MEDTKSITVNTVIRRLANYISIKSIDRTLLPSKKRDIRDSIRALQKVFQTVTCMDDPVNDDETDRTKSLMHIENSLANLIVPQSFSQSPIYIFKLLSSYSEIHEMLGHPEKAIENYKETIKLAQKYNQHDMVAVAQQRLGQLLLDQNNWESAVEQLELAMAYYDRIQSPVRLKDCYCQLGIAYQRMGKYAETIDYYQQALKLAEQIKDISSIAKLNMFLGVIYRILDDKTKSTQLLEHSHALYQQLDNVRGIVDTLNQLSLTNLQQSNYQSALSGFNKCIAYCRKIGDVEMLAYVNLNKADFYLKVGDPRNAAKYCTEALENIISGNLVLVLAKACSLLSRIFKLFHQDEIAKQLFTETMTIYQNLNLPLGLANCCSDYTDILIQTEHYDEAMECYQMARQIYLELKLDHYADSLDRHVDYAVTAENIPLHVPQHK